MGAEVPRCFCEFIQMNELNFFPFRSFDYSANKRISNWIIFRNNYGFFSIGGTMAYLKNIFISKFCLFTVTTTLNKFRVFFGPMFFASMNSLRVKLVKLSWAMIAFFRMSIMSVSFPGCKPAFFHCITSIFFDRAKKQMRWIDAWRIITLMANTDFFRYWADGDKIRNAVCSMRTAVNADGSVARVKKCANPHPAFIRTFLIDLAPKLSCNFVSYFYHMNIIT